MAIATDKVKELVVNETFEAPANGFSIIIADSEPFQLNGINDPVNIAIGYRDVSTSQTYTVGLIVGGIVDSVTLDGSINSRISSARGRDAAARLLDRYYEKIYTPSLDRLSLVEGSYEIEAQIAPISATAPSHRIPVSLQTSAKAIAEEICTFCGLSIVWQCRDYKIQDVFNATGRAIDILYQLISPWNFVEFLKVDISVQSNAVFFRQRSINYSPDYTFTIPNAKIKNLSISKKRSIIFGRVILEGASLASGLAEIPSTIGIGGSTFSDKEESKIRIIETLDQFERVIYTQTIIEKYRKPDGVLLEQSDILYDNVRKKIIKKTIHTNEWESPQYGTDGQINQPLQKNSITLTSEYDKNNILRETNKQEINYTFDGNRLLESELTETSKLSLKTNTLEKTEMVLKTLSDFGHNQVQQVTIISTISKKTGKLTVSTIDTQINNGQRPGGIQPPATIFIKSGSGQDDKSLSREVVRLEKILSTDPLAVPFTFNNKHLTLDDLNFIMNQLELINSGFVYELSWTGLSVPWIRKGNVIQFTGFMDEDSNEISLNPILITSIDFHFRENRELISQFSGQFWRST